MVKCPICNGIVKEALINAHIDSGCSSHLASDISSSTSQAVKTSRPTQVASIFSRPSQTRPFEQTSRIKNEVSDQKSLSQDDPVISSPIDHSRASGSSQPTRPDITPIAVQKRIPPTDESTHHARESQPGTTTNKRAKVSHLEKAAPLAERIRPSSLDEVCGQDLVGPSGILRGLIAEEKVPSMILWGGPGTGKTTIARLIAKTAGSRFVEINSTSSGVAECKKIFAEAKNELFLTSRKTILFCDEIHRFSKSQQDVFLGPVEAGFITLIGATTENPSFKVIDALLSRCRTFVLSKLAEADITQILQRALDLEHGSEETSSSLLDANMLSYLAAFADGDARTALNLLELALNLSKRAGITQDQLKRSLTHTLVYDRSGDQHYNTISAFHKSVRGSDADATLYYLARMLQSGEDPLFIARRMVVIASEDIGLADNSMLPLAVAAYTAVEKIGMPEARINLAHAAVALALSKKSTRSYRGLNSAMAAIQEPGIAGLPIPTHLRNAPTRLMRDLNYGREYKYNPDYVDGRVSQSYLPDELRDRSFLQDKDLGDQIDPDLS